MRRSPAQCQGGETQGPELALVGAAVAGVAALLLAAWKLPPVLILPAASLTLLAIGFALAFAVWDRPVDRRLSYRDVAAMLVFLGFIAALLSDVSALAALLDPPR